MIWNRIIDAVYPPLCQLCGERLAGDEECVCTRCVQSLSRIGFMPGSTNPVAERLAGLIPYERAAGIFIYSPGNLAARLVYDFKYHGQARLAQKMGRQMFEEMLFTDFFTDVDALVPVPIHWTRRLKRTYNQSRMLAEGVSSVSGIPIIEALRARRHSTQTRLTGAERLANASGKYYAVEDIASLLGGRRVVIIDDVCTTGSTLISAARALLAAYPDIKISILTYAVTV